MMVLVYLIIFVISLFFSKKKFNKYINVISIFNFLWCFFASLSTFGFYGLRIPSNKVHLYVCTFLIIFDIVALINIKNKQCLEETTTGITLFDRCDNLGNLYIVLQIVALITITPILINSVSSLIQSGFSAIRSTYFSEDYSSNYFFSYFFKQMPVSIIVALIINYIFLFFKYKKVKYVLFALGNVLLVTIVSGGRYAFLQIIYSLIIYLTMYDTSFIDVWFQKYKRIIFIVCAIAVAACVFVTLNGRSGGVIKGIVTYFSGSLSFLDLICENPKLFALDQKLYGYMTFSFITEPVVLFLKVLGLTSIKVPSYEFNIYCQKFYNISTTSSIYINNNTTILYYFLRDFGYAGIIIGAILFGLLLSYALNKWQEGNMFWGLMFAYLGVVLFNSIMTYQLFSCSAFFAIVALFLCSLNVRFIFGRSKV